MTLKPLTKAEMVNNVRNRVETLGVMTRCVVLEVRAYPWHDHPDDCAALVASLDTLIRLATTMRTSAQKILDDLEVKP